MEGAIIARCVYKNTSTTIPIYVDTSFMGLCYEVCSWFDELIVGEFQMTHVVLDHPSCLLKSDLDVRVLHLSCYIDKQNSVTIIINDCQSPCESNSGVNGNGFSFNIWDGATPSNTNDFIGKYVAPLPQTYLSHPLKTYINLVGQMFIVGGGGGL
ncbi:hypothetical protein D8674_037609 [Pyrus ussuriensis x Pyrus communis]|uniref:Uncharacterized protein n=1 Tax=Pyrus ussuriensis x Pyrus communis TaxID=2448454 RepID=A0A5N5H7Z4_9ROSA|nr:hypothetical protein D8674_037609 [Pyrus ussuriensis x Pyrus communis]